MVDAIEQAEWPASSLIRIIWIRAEKRVLMMIMVENKWVCELF
jgi:hypothetical protein